MQWFPIRGTAAHWDAKRLFNYMEPLSNAMERHCNGEAQTRKGGWGETRETRRRQGWLPVDEKILCSKASNSGYRSCGMKCHSDLGVWWEEILNIISACNLHPWVYGRIGRLSIHEKNTTLSLCISGPGWHPVGAPGPTLTFIFLIKRSPTSRIWSSHVPQLP